MSDYLGNLTARTLQITPLIQPRLASRFEPVQREGWLGMAKPIPQPVSASMTDRMSDEMKDEMSDSTSGFFGEEAISSRSIPPSHFVLPPRPRVEPAFRSDSDASRIAISGNEDRQTMMNPQSHRLPWQDSPWQESQTAGKSKTSPLSQAISVSDYPENDADKTDSSSAPSLQNKKTAANREHGDQSIPAMSKPLDAVERVGIQNHKRQTPQLHPAIVPSRDVATNSGEMESVWNKAGVKGDADRNQKTDQEPLSTIRPLEPEGLPVQQQPLTHVMVQPSVVGLSATQSSTLLATQPLRNESMPTIQVTIGRIEVRATMAQPTSTAKPVLSQNKTMSLQEYLQRRDGGGNR